MSMTLSKARETRDKNGLPCVIMVGTSECQAYAFCWGGDLRDTIAIDPFDCPYEIEVPGLAIPLEADGTYAIDSAKLFDELLNKVEAFVKNAVDTGWCQPDRIRNALYGFDRHELTVVLQGLSFVEGANDLRNKVFGWVKDSFEPAPVPESRNGDWVEVTVHGKKWQAAAGVDNGERALWLVPDEDAVEGTQFDQRYWQVDLPALLPEIEDIHALTDDELVAEAALAMNRYEVECDIDADASMAKDGEVDVIDGLRDWAAAGYRLAAAVHRLLDDEERDDLDIVPALREVVALYAEETGGRLPAVPALIPWLDSPEVTREQFEKMTLRNPD